MRVKTISLMLRHASMKSNFLALIDRHAALCFALVLCTVPLLCLPCDSHDDDDDDDTNSAITLFRK